MEAYKNKNQFEFWGQFYNLELGLNLKDKFRQREEEYKFILTEDVLQLKKK